jgi:hypothetical protein
VGNLPAFIQGLRFGTVNVLKIPVGLPIGCRLVLRDVLLSPNLIIIPLLASHQRAKLIPKG